MIRISSFLEKLFISVGQRAMAEQQAREFLYSAIAGSVKPLSRFIKKFMIRALLMMIAVLAIITGDFDGLVTAQSARATLLGTVTDERGSAVANAKVAVFDLEKRAVADVQRMLAFELDAELPNFTFTDWFKKVVGPEAGVIWQLSECGGPQESPGATRDIRACVEVSTILPDSRLVSLRITVGTFKKGMIGAPAFYFGAIEQEGELYPIRRLRDLPKLLRTPSRLTKRPVKLPELNIPKLAAARARMLGSAELSEAPLGELALDEDPQPEPPPPLDSVAPSKPPSAALRQGAAIRKAQPVYPPNAKIFNASGQVEVRVTISEAGRVKEAVAVSGHPLLRDAAVEAARKWFFNPTTVNGVPTETRLVLTFDFSPR